MLFDFGLLGVGPRYSDCRNVVGSPGKAAASAFWATYGPVKEREAILDEPLAELYSLSVAASRRNLPGWAGPSILSAENGDLERAIDRAMLLESGRSAS